MPHGNLWGWGETGRRDSVSAVAADAAPEPSKAGRLLVLVNPAAGKGRGVAAYERDVAPVLAALSGCGVVVEMRVTALRGEAMKIAGALDLDAYRAVVCVGGDGTLAEVFNGLMTRPDATRAQSFPVGVVPAGSGNAIARSLAHRVAQPCDTATAALAIARGHLVSLDRAEFRAEEVDAPDETAKGDGLETAKDGETAKVAGVSANEAWSARRPKDRDARAAVAVVGFFQRRGHRVGAVEVSRWGAVHGGRHRPRFVHATVRREDSVQAARRRGRRRRRVFPRRRIQRRRRRRGRLLQQVRHQPESKAKGGSSYAPSGAHRMGNPHDSRAAKRAAKAAARGATAGTEMPDRPGWREIAGDDVQGVWALNLPWAAEDMFAAPAAQCSDGAFDLLVFKGHSRLSLLLNLLKLDAGRHVPHSRVTYVKASELEVVPGASSTGQGGYIAVDGELVARAREVNVGGAGGGGGGGGRGAGEARWCAW